MTLRKPKVAIGQAGGPTAVINASLLAFIEEAQENFEVYGIVNAMQGLIEDWFVHIDQQAFDKAQQFRDVPGAFLGSGRWSMNEADFSKCIEHLRKRDIRHLVLIGGNGTMWSCMQLQRKADEVGYEMKVLGIPKTVDNDLSATDHTPGYGSAARYVAMSVRDIGQDLRSMRNFEKVRIIETMGRNVGWLAAAGALLKQSEDQPPHLIYLPERPFQLEQFLTDVTKSIDTIGYCTVVMSEGVRDEEGRILSEITLNGNDGPKVLGGASQFLAQQVVNRLKLPARSELLGMNQRSAQFAVSVQDQKEAGELGKEAAVLLQEGVTGMMLTLQRELNESGPYKYRIGRCRFDEVAGKERLLPDTFIDSSGTGVNQAFKDWLRPLVGDDIQGFPEWRYPLSKI
jgi:6-phosphofructokinase